ncbi:hypothetical protein [Haliangium sp.]|uniref:hypothetical protein n=1 Tax=Haliangium sp. TaxID=2663208 RepID=UPI003D124459
MGIHRLAGVILIGALAACTARSPAPPPADNTAEPAQPAEPTPVQPAEPVEPDPVEPEPVEPASPPQAPPSAGNPTPTQGQACPEGQCAEGLSCLSYYGIAGPKGPTFTSCERPCAGDPSACLDGEQCVQIADGPGAVCRPR